MIVTSEQHPYKPSQASNKHRLSSDLQQAVGQPRAAQRGTMASLHNASNSSASQQNSLYGAFDALETGQHQHQHQQHHQQQQQQQHQHQTDLLRPRCKSHLSELAKLQQAGAFQSPSEPLSLYSPSSSTSLLYHIYDQINLPSEPPHYGAAQSQQQHQELVGAKKASTTTILNPANLFGGSASAQHQQQASGQLPMQHYYASGTLAHQQPFGLQSSYLQAGQQQPMSQTLMLDTVLRQQHAARNQRPLSSSAGSSLSGGVAYGRHPRSATTKPAHQHLTTGPHHTLAAHLDSQARLAFGLSRPDLQTGSTGLMAGKGSSAAPTPMSPLFTNRWGKRASQNLRHLLYEYRTIIKCSLLLILLAFTLMSLLKFTLLSPTATSAPPKHHSQSHVVPTSGQQHTYHTPTAAIQHHSSSSQSQSSSSSNNNNNNYYPASLFSKLDVPSSGPSDATTLAEHPQPAESNPQQPEPVDVLKSKLLIGEFVILSQNYSHSAAQKSLLAERIVKLMDQVFLSTDVQRVYSRTEVTNIRPNRPSGIVVDCNVILSDSIAYAAQQFGIALYDSLARSQERLANQAGYIIDKNSIRFNTVPDKDLKAGLVPPGLLSAAVSRELNSDQSPSGGQQIQPVLVDSNSPHPDQAEQLNSVVWSEWSQWSSCVDKNGICDPGRLHSRLRRCVAQHTGEKVDASQCKQRFNPQDQELEVADCSRSCNQQQLDSATHVMSDAPSVIGPQTAPSVLVGSEPSFLAPILGEPAKQQMASGQARDMPAQPLVSSPASSSAPPTTERVQPVSASPSSQPANEVSPTSTTLVPQLVSLDQQQPQQHMSCSNCTTDEICLLLVQQKVPFCAKIKDRQDETGCGGWCNSGNQLCQPVGQNAFKCIHDSECLADEWRCHDSACIPLSKRCDGHSNCYDSSDERDCPSLL